MVIKRMNDHEDGLELGVDVMLKISVHWLPEGENTVFSALGKNYHQ